MAKFAHFRNDSSRFGLVFLPWRLWGSFSSVRTSVGRHFSFGAHRCRYMQLLLFVRVSERHYGPYKLAKRRKKGTGHSFSRLRRWYPGWGRGVKFPPFPVVILSNFIWQTVKNVRGFVHCTRKTIVALSIWLIEKYIPRCEYNFKSNSCLYLHLTCIMRPSVYIAVVKCHYLTTKNVSQTVSQSTNYWWTVFMVTGYLLVSPNLI